LSLEQRAQKSCSHTKKKRENLMSIKLSVIGDIYSEEVFKVIMDYEIARAKRYPTPTSLVCIEIFPQASNQDTLQAAPNLFASALKKYMRSADIPCVNGKEFKIMLPVTNQNGLNAACERMLSTLNNTFETDDGNTISFSLCIGGTTYEGVDKISSDELLKKGQAALDQAKQKGQNTYIIL
jgi:diguanylate cyclase (GGDEF)-like protein